MDILKQIDWLLLRSKIAEAVRFLPHFLRNPVEGMRSIPQWDWPTTLILHAGFAATCGVVRDVVARNIFGAIFAVLLAPISVLILSLIFAGLFYYTFHFVFHRQIPFQRIYIHLFFASIPILVINTVSSLLPPLSLLGVFAPTILLYIGFITEFQLERQKVKKLLGVMIFVYVLFWIVQMVQFTQRSESFRAKAMPESLKILEDELKP